MSWAVVSPAWRSSDVECGGLGVVGEADGVGFVDRRTAGWRGGGRRGRAGLRERATSTDVGLVAGFQAGLKVCSCGARLSRGRDRAYGSMQAVPVAVRRTCWSLAGDEGIAGGELPVFAGGVLEVEGGAGEGIEAPEAGDGAGDGGGFGGGEFVGGFVGGGVWRLLRVIFRVIGGVREGVEG